MLREFLLTGAAAAALFFPISADAGSAITTNPGARYVPYGGVGRFHTNPGGKYVYRGYGEKFHTNPGGKYVYPNWSQWQPGGPRPLISNGAGRSGYPAYGYRYYRPYYGYGYRRPYYGYARRHWRRHWRRWH